MYVLYLVMGREGDKINLLSDEHINTMIYVFVKIVRKMQVVTIEGQVSCNT